MPFKLIISSILAFLLSGIPPFSHPSLLSPFPSLNLPFSHPSLPSPFPSLTLPFSHPSLLSPFPSLTLSLLTSSTQDESRFLRDVLSKVSEKDDATNRHLQEAKENNLNLSESLHRATLELQVLPHHSRHFSSLHFSYSISLPALHLLGISRLSSSIVC
jgi:hypothetical protein